MKLKIGVLTYDLQLVDNITNKSCLGDFDIDDGTTMGITVLEDELIQVRSQLNKEQRIVTLLHEIVHCMLFEIGKIELSSDEGFVDSFAKQIYQMLKNNNINKITEYITKR